MAHKAALVCVGSQRLQSYGIVSWPCDWAKLLRDSEYDGGSVAPQLPQYAVT